MTDFADEAAAIEQTARDNALARHRASRPAVASEDALDCGDCGEEIPAARRTALPGCARCIDCQTDYEQKKALHA